MKEEPFVVDIDDTTETPRRRIDFVLDKEKAALHGVSTAMITGTLRTASSGGSPATVHRHGERQPLPVKLILPRAKRSGILALTPDSRERPRRQNDSSGGTGDLRGSGGRPAHLPQEPGTGGICVRGDGRPRAGRSHSGHAETDR